MRDPGQGVTEVTKSDIPQQMGLFGEPPRLFVCTPSRLASYEDCPRRYRYSYLDRPTPSRGAPWAHNSLGASVHTALRAWFDLPSPKRTTGALATLLRATWVREGYRDGAQEQEAYERALGWLGTYVDSLPPGFEPLAVERTVGAKTATLALSGRVDRIDDVGGELVIVDYKTGRTGLGPDDARGSRALALYAYAAGRLFRRACHRVELHHLPTGSWRRTSTLTSRWPATSVGRSRRRPISWRPSGGWRRGTDPDEAFPATPGSLCGWCDFRRSCPAGAQRPGHEPWAGLDRTGSAG